MAVELTNTPSFRLDGKRALVTGGGRGIGLAAGSALAQAGADVTLAARTRAEIEAAAQAIRARGDKAQALALDVTDIDAVRGGIADAESFDILVNNAGTNRPAPLLDVTVEDFDLIMGLNARAAFFVAQAVAQPADRGQAARLDHQYFFADGACRRRTAHGLLRLEARDGGIHQGDGDRACAPQHPRQQPRAHVPGNADDAAILREQGVS